MDFAIIDLIDEEQATAWLLKHFHPEGLHCRQCGADVEAARLFGWTRKSHLCIYWCLSCDGVYNLYSGTVFEQKQLTPPQAVLLLRGVCQGVPSAKLAREIGPPIVGTLGRESGHVRLRTVHHTDRETLTTHVHQFTPPGDPRLYRWVAGV